MLFHSFSRILPTSLSRVPFSRPFLVYRKSIILKLLSLTISLGADIVSSKEIHQYEDD